ncbi:MAG: DUF1499 domain-containing protein [Gammaproteobacteria bacterium]|nr:DUF1499 domain-containing protein [Gammaproteobacteria bacterium]
MAASTPTSRGALTCGWTAVFLLVLTAVLFAVAGPGHRTGLLSLNTAFLVFTVGALGAVLSLVLGVIGTVWNLRSGSRALAGGSLLATIVGLGLTINLVSWFLAAQAVPAIHDISTDTDDPPAFVALLALRAEADNPPEHPGVDVAALQREAYPDLRSLRLAATPQTVFAASLQVAHELGWEIVAEMPTEGRIEATDTTRYFGFRDDVVIRIEAQNGETVLDIRSKSRVGMSDVGVNAARIRAFRERLLQLI